MLPSHLPSSRNKNTGLSRRAMRKEANFWERLSCCVSAQTYQIWNVLHDHMRGYYEMLKRRHAAVQEVTQLTEQNAQLKTLLNQYLSSKVNEELMVPPIQTL